MVHPNVDLASFSITRHAADPRADGASRVVHVSATKVTIERTFDGVRMRLGVPVAAYRGLVLAVQAPNGRATLSLRHDDRELDVLLGQGEPEAVARSANAWGRVLGKSVAVEQACVERGDPLPRRKRAGPKQAVPKRRSSFARRRKAGIAARMEHRFAAEREIIARD